MKLLKHWHKGKNNPDTGHAMARRGDTHHAGLTSYHHFRERMDEAFNQMWRQIEHDPWAPLSIQASPFAGVTTWPAIDVIEDDKALKLQVDVPGLDEKNLEMEVSGNLLTIRGSREDEWDTKQAHGVSRRERVSGSFARTITLPSYVDPQHIEAKYVKGTLTVTVPKIPELKPRRVHVTKG